MKDARPLIAAVALVLLQILFGPVLPAQVAAFLSPDTVYVNQPVSITNTSAGGSSWYWNFCSGNANRDPVGENIGNPGYLLDIPTYLTLVKQGNDCFSFISCQGVGVVRYWHGSSFKNDPVSWKTLGTLGQITFNEEGIQVKEDNGQWYGFVCSDYKLVRLNFGNSLWNTPTATSLNFPLINMLHGLVVTKEGGTWIGFATCSLGNTLLRFNFGNSLLNTPVMTDFGNIAGFSSPGAICLVQENALWYGLIAAGNNTLARITFGNSLLNTPTGVNLGNPGGFSYAVGLTLVNDCESTVAYWTNYLYPGQLGKLVFPNGIAGPVTGEVLGDIGTLAQPHSFSELFRQNDTLYSYITNRGDGSLTRLTFPPCNNASVPSSTLHTPPAFSYNTPGTYNIRLIMNEGLPTQSAVCKNIVVLPPPANVVAAFTAPDTICTGQQVNISNQSTPGATCYWNFCSGNVLSDPAGINIGNPGNLLNIPGYITLVKDGITCYSFITTHGSNRVVRYNHGSSFSNNPVSWTNLGDFGLISDTVQGIKIRNDNGTWIGIVVDNTKIVRLNFGSSVANTPTATILGTYSLLYFAHGLDLFYEGGDWIGFVTCSWGNRLVRLNFGNSLLNSPVLTDLGTPGAMNMPTTFCIIKEFGTWTGIVVNYGDNTLTRFSFGSSLLNPPNGVNLGNVCPSITAAGIALIRDCENTVGYQLNTSPTSPDLVWRLTFPNGINGPVTGTSLGNIGNLRQPLRFSELFRSGDTLFLYATNRLNASLTRLSFLPCTGASVLSSSQYAPPAFSYSQPGTYNIQLIVNEGLPNQTSVCKSIVVKACPVTPTVAFTAPDTVCVGSQVNITNQSTPGGTYYWSFCSGNTLSDPVGVNIGNPGNLLDIPTYITLVKQGTDCFSFVSCQGVGVVRYFHGTSFNNNPVSWTNLGTFGAITFNQEGIQVKQDNGQWYGFVCSDTKLVRLDFGTSLWNTPTATSLAFSGLTMLHGLWILKEGTTWVGFGTCSIGNKMVRFNFGTSLLNSPVMTDFGTPGAMSMPGPFQLVQETGLWYGLVTNLGNSTMTRISFGSSLLNTPTGVNLGAPCAASNPMGLALIRDCGVTTGFLLNYSTTSPDLIWRLSYPSGITGPVTGTSLGNIGNLSRPSLFSEIFRTGDTLFMYCTNRDNFTLTRFRFLPCSNASVQSSSQYNPPPYTYTQPGTYNIQLIVNEGLPNQATVCKSIVVKTCPVNTTVAFTAPDTVCTGTDVTVVNQSAGGSSYYWSFCPGNTLADPIGTNIGNPFNLLNVGSYITLVRDAGTCYSFITNHGVGDIVRYNHGSSFSNNPVAGTNLGNFGLLGDSILGIKICYDNGQWIGFVTNNNRIARLNFGNSLANTPVAINLGPYPILNSGHCIDIVHENNTWVGFITCYWGNTMVRLNFGNSLLNQPILTDLGLPGSMDHPGNFRLINENNAWYALVMNFATNTYTRLTFGTSLLNIPTGENIGVVCPDISPAGFALIRDCQATTGFQLNYTAGVPDQLWRLTFNTGITGSVTGMSLGNIGSMNRPAQFSELVREGDTLILYNTNRVDFTLTRLLFLPCSNASVPSSTQYSPPPVSYNQPGVYNIQLIVNEGLPNQASLCKNIVVVNKPTMRYVDTTICHGTEWYAGGAWQTQPGIYHDTIRVAEGCDSIIQTTLAYKPEIPVSLGNDTMFCNGIPILLNTGVSAATYQWQDGSIDSTYTAFGPGNYWVTVTKYGCNESDSISIGACVSPLWFPNVFTPNGDGLNDTFHPVGVGVLAYSILIYDRWGKKIFESGQIEPGWDGSINGSICSDGVYVYIATYQLGESSGETYHARGSVTLLR